MFEGGDASRTFLCSFSSLFSCEWFQLDVANYEPSFNVKAIKPVAFQLIFVVLLPLRIVA